MKSHGSAATTDVNHRRVRINPGVVFRPVRQRGVPLMQIELPGGHRYFRIGQAEYLFLSFLEGGATVATACGMTAAKLGSAAPGSAQAQQIVRWLVVHRIATLIGASTPIAPADGRSVAGTVPAGDGDRGDDDQRFNPLWVKLPLVRQATSFAAVGRYLGWLFGTVPALLVMLTVGIAGLSVATQWDRFVQPGWSLVSVDRWWQWLVVWVALKVWHEAGHAAACVVMGATVRSAGVVWVMLAPMAYVDVSGCWSITSRRKRMIISAAGIYFEFIVAAVAAILWAWVDPTPERQAWLIVLQQVVITAGVSTLVFNANPLMKFDGYYLLADAIDVPDLYDAAKAWSMRIGRRIIGSPAGGPLDTPIVGLRGWRRPLVIVYAVASMLWRWLVGMTLVVTSATMYQGLGIVLAAVAAAFWYGRPLMALLRILGQRYRQGAAGLIRPLAGIVITAAMVWLVATEIPVPTYRRGAGVVRYVPQCQVRSQSDGIVDRLHVRAGQRVRRGDLLMTLRNEPLQLQISQAKIRLRQCELLQQQALDAQDVAEHGVQVRRHHAIGQQLQHLLSEAAGWTVAADRDGRVIATDWDQRLGTWVRRGDLLCQIATESDKEVLVLIDQSDIDAVRTATRQSVPIVAAGWSVRRGIIRQIEPTASLRLPAVALATSAGGPLAVMVAPQRESPADRGGEEDVKMTLTKPHFSARIELAGSDESLPAGLVIQARLGYRLDPLATRLATLIRQITYRDDVTPRR